MGCKPTSIKQMIKKEAANAWPAVPPTWPFHNLPSSPQRDYSEPFGLSGPMSAPKSIAFEVLPAAGSSADQRNRDNRTYETHGRLWALAPSPTHVTAVQDYAVRILLSRRRRHSAPPMRLVAESPWAHFPDPHLLLCRWQTAGGESEHQSGSVAKHRSLVWALVEQQQLGAARRLLALLPNEPSLRKVRRVLNPPQTSISNRRSANRAADYEWLTRHAHDYRGQWLAVLGGSLVAAEPSLKALRRCLSGLSLPSAPLLHHVE